MISIPFSINNEICYNLEQLRGYFAQELNAGSNLYNEMLTYGRNGVIARWLLTQGEDCIADRIFNISNKLGDSDYIKKLGEVICDITVVNDFLKYPVENCLQYVDCDIDVKEDLISIKFRVINEINEEYSISVSCRLGLYSTNVNLWGKSEGYIISVKIPIKNINEVDWLSINSDDHIFHMLYRCPNTIYIKIRNTWLSLYSTSEGYYYADIPFLNWLALLPVGSTKNDSKYVNRSYIYKPFFMEAMGCENRMQKINNFLSLIRDESKMKFELHTQIDDFDKLIGFSESRILNISNDEGYIPITVSFQEYIKCLKEGNKNILNIMNSNFGIFNELGEPLDFDESLKFLTSRLQADQEIFQGKFVRYQSLRTLPIKY